jgi:phosphoheptose isomerase
MEPSQIAERLRQSGQVKARLAEEQAESIGLAAEVVATALTAGGKAMLFGNGGSAADAQHIATEFVCRLQRDRRSLPALALTTNSSILTAIGNDYGFEQVFARQVQALGKPGDVVIAISVSGRSSNVLAGVRVARQMGLASIGLTGGNGGELASLVDVPIVVTSSDAARIQECHIAVGHLFCEAVEEVLQAGELLPRPAHSRAEASKVMGWEELLALRERWRAEGKTVVWTNGCFDLLHLGHVHSLQAAKALGDVLVVGVNGDNSVRKLKGSGRPLFPVSERAELLAALGCVDYVVSFEEFTPEEALTRLKPDVHCKGADYGPPHGQPIPEAKVVEAYGGRVEFLPLQSGHSTSELVRRIREMSEEREREEGRLALPGHRSAAEKDL